ncbi:MAG: hypothetical protein KKB02_09855, partial [Alphaproteobacteria bacterium]|nr:hypothetical protein [Alphaproteobacteria bacterium]
HRAGLFKRKRHIFQTFFGGVFHRVSLRDDRALAELSAADCDVAPRRGKIASWPRVGVLRKQLCNDPVASDSWSEIEDK